MSSVAFHLQPVPSIDRLGSSPLVVVNARAGAVRDLRAVQRAIERAFRAVGAPAEVVATWHVDELPPLLAAADGRRIVLAGGDGTLHAVAALPVRPAELALLPLGTAGNVARTLGVPRGLERAAALAIRGTARPLDALEVATPAGTLIAVEGISAGLHAAARANYHADGSGHFGEGLRAAASVLGEWPRYRLALRLDSGEVLRREIGQVFLANLERYAFGLRVDPAGNARDGVAEAILLPPGRRRDLPRTVAELRRGRHLERPGVELRRWRTAELLAPLPLAVDATPLAPTTATITVRPGHLRVVAGR